MLGMYVCLVRMRMNQSHITPFKQPGSAKKPNLMPFRYVKVTNISEPPYRGG